MRILVPLDGSTLSESIITYLERLLPQDIDLVLLRVAPVHAAVPVAGEGGLGTYAVGVPREVLAAEAEEYVETLATALRGKGYLVTTRVEFGNPAEIIVERAKTLGVDLIAMSTHGRSGLSRLLFGSVAEAVLRRSPVAVLALSAARGQAEGDPGKSLPQKGRAGD
ncbi:MAG: universal stress protein [Chloroflexi bacterium]|nr:universal stress protein [Chloroflexota bacterium]